MLKQLKQVKEFHKLFGQPVLETPQIPSKERCKLRIELIQEELNELKEALENEDIVATGDALSDITYVVNGTYHEVGLAKCAEELFTEVQNSNMSKACKNLAEAEATINFYKDKDGTQSYFKQVEGKYLIYRKSDGKVLKSINYSPVDLKKIIFKKQYKNIIERIFFYLKFK